MIFFKDKKTKATGKVTLYFCLIVSVFIISFSQKQYHNFKREKCQLLCQTAANKFQSDLNEYIIVNTIIEAVIVESNGLISKFDSIAENFINKLPALECIQLAPKGIITKSYPYAIYEGVGTSLFESPETKISSNYSLKTRQTCLTGPVTFSSGKTVLIIQHPVFLKEENGTEKFWGFSVIHLRLNSLFKEDTLNFLENSDYSYCLWKPDPQISEISNLAQNTATEIKNPCEAVFTVTNSPWTLYTAPKEGWINKKLLLLEIIFCSGMSLILSTVISFLISLKDRDEALERLSYRDTLTNLYNARKFIVQLKAHQKKLEPYTIIYLDLNDFKQINDTLGHETGDQVLVIAARKLSNCIRETDSAFRIGGDEFAVIIPGANSTDFVEHVIIRIKESISRETVLKNARLQVISSAGFARCPEDSTDYEEVIKIADKGMYEDKRSLKAAKKAEENLNRS